MVARMKTDAKAAGAAALATGGFGAAFALAACCGLPVLLAGAGVGAAWLVPIARASSSYSSVLTVLAILGLAGSALLLLAAPRVCKPGSLCARPAFRLAIAAVAASGAALLFISKAYS